MGKIFPKKKGGGGRHCTEQHRFKRLKVFEINEISQLFISVSKSLFCPITPSVQHINYSYCFISSDHLDNYRVLQGKLIFFCFSGFFCDV